MDGFSVCLTTYNDKPGRELLVMNCLEGLRKYSTLDNQLIIHVDGYGGCTDSLLRKEDIPFSQSEWRGIYHGWNRTAERAEKDFLILLSDDMFVGPDWDINLSKWVKKEQVIVPRLVEPGRGSYPPPYDCGKNPDKFNEEKFIRYARKIMEHSLKPHTFGAFAMNTKRYSSIGGFDEQFDPIGVGSIDLILELKKKYPETEFFEALDVIIYHFQMKTDDVPNKEPLCQRSVKRFERKWGFGVGEGYKTLKVSQE